MTYWKYMPRDVPHFPDWAGKLTEEEFQTAVKRILARIDAMQDKLDKRAFFPERQQAEV